MGDDRWSASEQSRYLLSNATVPTACLSDPLPSEDDLSRADILIADGNIEKIARTIETDAPIIDLDLDMVWPAFIDIHTHLDKGHIWARNRNPDGSFDGALAATGTDRSQHWTAEDVRARMNFSLQSAYAHGSKLLRTHLDSVPPQHQISWPLFQEVRADWAGRIELQAVSIVGVDSVLDGNYFTDLLSQIQAADGVLGVVTYPIPEIREALDIVFRAAQERGMDLDLHVDETGDAQVECLRYIAEAAIKFNFQGRIVCGHCCSIAKQHEDQVEETLDLVEKAGIAIVSLPMCNMYLQDRNNGNTPRWRGVTLLSEMAARGIPVAVASDNTRDPFYAYGDLDMIEVYREATRILHFDHPVGDWPSTVTKQAADIVGRSDIGRIAPGVGADLVICRARTWTELLSRPQADRTIIRDGSRISPQLPDYRELDYLMRK